MSTLHVAEDAIRRLRADMERTGRAEGPIVVTVDEDDMLHVTTANGGAGWLPDVSDESLVAEIADLVQGEISCDQGSLLWPVCPTHDRGLHAVVQEALAVWWCSGGHSYGPIGGLSL